jgi:hypothetical protein
VPILKIFYIFFFYFSKISAPQKIYQIYTLVVVSYGNRIQTSYHTAAGSGPSANGRGAAMPCQWARDPSHIWHGARVPNAKWHDVSAYRLATQRQPHAYISSRRLPPAHHPLLPSSSLSSPRWSSGSTSDPSTFLVLSPLVYKF